MADFSRDKDKTVEVPPALKEAGTDLSSPKNALRSPPSALSGLDNRILDPFNGDNPPSIGPAADSKLPGRSEPVLYASLHREDTLGLRAPSSFAARIEQGSAQRDSSVNGSLFSSEPVVDSSQNSPEIASDKAPPPASPAQPGVPRREIVIKLYRRPEATPAKVTEKSHLTKEQVIAERNEQLPKRVDVTNPTEMKAALEKAAKLGVPVVAYFGATWCGPCQGLKKNVLAKMEGSGQSQVKAVFVHIDVDKATNRSGKSDGGAAIAKSIGVPLGSTVPQVNVLALNRDTGKFLSVAGNLGATDYKRSKIIFQELFSAEYVAQNRQKLVKAVNKQFA